MIEALLIRFGVRNAARWAHVAALLGAALAVAALGYMTVTAARDVIESARQTARAERDAFWAGEIAKAAAEAQKARAEQALRASAAEARAAEDIRRLAGQLNDLERLNAALPRGDACGLDRDRVRLLSR